VRALPRRRLLDTYSKRQSDTTVAQAYATSEPISLVRTAEEPLEAEVRIGVHDASRLEWSVSLPLPEKMPKSYSIDVELDIPSNAFAQHAPWNQLQTFTRLEASDDPIRRHEAHAQTIDSLRRGAVTLAHRLARASDGFSRHALLARDQWVPELERGLALWVDSALKTAADAREKLVVSEGKAPVEVCRERVLVDEYISVRLLEMLAGVERALETLIEEASPKRREELAPVVTALEEKIAAALEREVGHRTERKYLRTDATSSAALEKYLDRSSQLKKHFQEVLFLEPEVYEVAARLHHWAAGAAALVASTWAFALQIILVNRAGSAGTEIGSGIVMLAVLGGLVYASKDRLKELGRVWIAGNVHRFYAQRVARFRAPARRLPKRDVIVTARESFDSTTSTRPDPLNPESGAELHGMLLRYSHKGSVLPCEELSASGVRRIKHVFRYDFSPLFARLDDAVKKVPVVEEGGRRVRFVDAPRCYRMPVRLSVRSEGRTWSEEGTLVLHKRGLDRLERAGRSTRETVMPDPPAIGIEPDHGH
jgi:hypothetical protein